MLDEDAGLLERARVEEELDALARGEAPFGMQLSDALLAPSLENGLPPQAEFFDGGTSGQVVGSN